MLRKLTKEQRALIHGDFEHTPKYELINMIIEMTPLKELESWLAQIKLDEEG